MIENNDLRVAIEHMEDTRRLKTQKVSDIWHKYNKQLNNPVWLINQITAGYNEATIAQKIGCSEWLVHEKAKIVFQAKDQIFGTYTGFFHTTKKFIGFMAKPYIKKIQQGVDSVYDKTKSRNAGIFKEIINEIEAFDDDTGTSMAGGLGLTRKAFILLATKFLVCLYEYDTHYAERMDYVIKRILERKEEIYLDDVAKPENWYPHRGNNELITKYMILRNKPKE